MYEFLLILNIVKFRCNLILYSNFRIFTETNVKKFCDEVSYSKLLLIQVPKKTVVIKNCSQLNGTIVSEKKEQSIVIFNNGHERIHVFLES